MLISKMTAMDPSKPTSIALLQRIGRTFFAAFWLVALPLGAWAASTTTQQSAYLQGTPAQSFEEVRNAAFKAYPKMKKLPLHEKAAWIKLHFDKVNLPEEARYLLLRHDLVEQAWLYRPDPGKPNQWTREHINLAEERFIALGHVQAGEDVYLFIPRAVDIPIVTFVGTKDEVVNYEQRIDIAVAIIVAIGSSLAFYLILSSLTSFSWASAVGAIYFLALILLFLTVAGALRNLMPQLTMQQAQTIYTFGNFSLYFFGFSFLCIVVSELLKKTNVFRFAWSIPLAMVLVFIYSFVDTNNATLLNKYLEIVMIFTITLLIIIQLGINGLRIYKKYELLGFIVLLLVFLISNVNRSAVNWTDSVNSNNLIEFFDYPTVLYFLGGSFYLNLVILKLLHAISENNKRKELDQQLTATTVNYEVEKRALAKQRQLTGMLAHEIKNPLAASHFALANIEAHSAEKDFAADRLSSIKQSLNEINDIIDKCVEVDLYEQGLLASKLQKTSLEELISHLKKLSSDDRIYTITRDLDTNLQIQGDVFYVKTILHNLISNALKYSAKDSLVEVLFATHRQNDSDFLSVSVSNEPGIAGHPDKNQVFTRFYRAESARNVSGTGTGLWLAKQMAQDIGAELELQEGTSKITFNILFKLTP